MTEALEIACLEEFWASHTGKGPPLDEMVGKLLLDTLGLGNQQVFEQLYLVKPDFAGFAQWILDTAGAPDPRLVDRYHAWLYDMPPGEEAQAVLYLSDTAEDQGAFRCVPGFHKRIDDWLAGLNGANPREADLSAEVKHVAGKAGDLIIWRQDLPHAASPNRSDKPRLAQYLTYYSPDMVIRPWR